jgi:hypothetical protein
LEYQTELPVNPKGIRATRDGGLFIHPSALDASDSEEGSSIRVPQVATELGAGFGDTITDDDRQFASEREPVANKLTYGVARDVFDKWFTIDDPSTEGGDPKIDEAVQNALTVLKAKEKLTKAVEYERIYGWSLIVGSFNDVSDVKSLEKPLRQGSQLKQIEAYPKTKVIAWTTDEKPNSLRFGEPEIYMIYRGEGEYLYIHYSRCFKVQTRINGSSVLNPVWDDLTCGRNIRWGAAQWMYRTGGGFPVIKFPLGTTIEQLEEWVDSSAFSNLMSRTYIGITGDMDFDFKGAAGSVLDPQPFFHTNLEQISAGSGIPEPMLRGAQAGALTGSEVNQQQYYKVISGIQACLESAIRWVIDRLVEAGQVSLLQQPIQYKISDKMRKWLKLDAVPRPEPLKYVVTWVSAFELSELDEKRASLLEEQANEVRLKYMTKDEVRAMNDLNPLTEAQKKEMAPAPFQPFGQQPQNNPNQNQPLTSNNASDKRYTVIEHASTQNSPDSKDGSG